MNTSSKQNTPEKPEWSMKLHSTGVSQESIKRDMDVIANHVYQVSRGVNSLLGQIDLTDEATMKTAQELLKRQAFLQSTLKFLTDITVKPAK